MTEKAKLVLYNFYATNLEAQRKCLTDKVCTFLVTGR